MRHTSHVIPVLLASILFFLATISFTAPEFSGAIVFSDAGFPADPLPDQFAALIPGARISAAVRLPNPLKDPATQLFVLPHGSAFAERSWPEILAFGKSGGRRVWKAGHYRVHDSSGCQDRFRPIPQEYTAVNIHGKIPS